jgi:hypothetical protein
MTVPAVERERKRSRMLLCIGLNCKLWTVLPPVSGHGRVAG